MCRHLSGVANVSFREADTPRIRSSMVWGAMLDNSKLANPDFIDTIYSSDMSAACRFHCVNKWDENGIVLAARRDIVEAGLAPAEVAKLAKKLAGNPRRSENFGQGGAALLRRFRHRSSCDGIGGVRKARKSRGR